MKYIQKPMYLLQKKVVRASSSFVHESVRMMSPAFLSQLQFV